ncbi:MAG: sugar ABC transporter permease, partial [Tepidisphaeraceae bacterium]
MLPFLMVTGVFFIYPLIQAAILAFYQTNGPTARVYVGLENVRFILHDPDFYTALRNTSIFAVASVALQLP